MQIEKLTESEEIVMKAVWDCKKEPVLSEIMERTTDIYGKDWKPQTVSTFLSNLVWKKYLKMQRNGKKCTYTAQVDEQTYRIAQLRRLYILLYKNDIEALQQDVQEL